MGNLLAFVHKWFTILGGIPTLVYYVVALAGVSHDKIVECAKEMLGRENNWEDPFGGGTAGRKIVEIVNRR